jgi:hypothetical protein
MAWIYFQEAADSQKDCTDGCGPSLTVRSSPELSVCSCPAWPEENYTRPPFGMMCGRCAGLCSPRWISSPGVSPARTSALLALELAWGAAEAGLCLNTSASLASADPDSSSWKTYQLSLFGGSIAYSWDSMRWGMMRDGQLFQPQRWEPRIIENEFGFLPTPIASNTKSVALRSGGRPPKSYLPTPTVCGNHNAPKMGTARGMGLSTWAKLWPSPKASEASRGDSPSERKRKTPCLSAAVVIGPPDRSAGSLNPTWVEWLMGWPIGSTVCESWVMESSHFARRKRSKG